MSNPLTKQIILASKSPRRSQLLKEAGFQFEIKTKEISEDYPAALKAEKVPAYLAEKKAELSKDFLESGKILLAADSVVILDDIIFEKPKDHEDAVRILSALSGNEHQVITGVCLLSQKNKKVFSGISKVQFEVLSEDEIEFYINNYQPYDKAGAYAIQEWIGLCKISKIEGTYSNIMGLPMEQVYRELMEFE